MRTCDVARSSRRSIRDGVRRWKQSPRLAGVRRCAEKVRVTFETRARKRFEREYSGWWAALQPELSPQARQPPTMHERHEARGVGFLVLTAGPAIAVQELSAGPVVRPLTWLNARSAYPRLARGPTEGWEGEHDDPTEHDRAPRRRATSPTACSSAEPRTVLKKGRIPRRQRSLVVPAD
jgi:hypothetical protein